MSEEPQVSGDQTMEAAAPLDNGMDQSQSESVSMGHNVPLDALQAEREKRQRLEDENRMYRENMQLMMAQNKAPQPQSQPNEFEGVAKDDVLTYGDLEKILSKKEQQYQSNIQELRMTQKYPDYNDVVTRYLPEVLKSNPGLRNTLQQSNDYELAYHLAKNSDSYRQGHKKTKTNAEAERIVQNAQRPGSLSSTGQTSPISEAKRFKDMSDNDFKKVMNKNLGYF